MTDEIVFGVEIESVLSMRLLDGFCERVFSLGNHDVMDVIAHQRVFPYLSAVPMTSIAHQPEINEPIGIIAEDVGFSIPSLKDMMWTSGYNNAWKSQRCDSSREGAGQKESTAGTRCEAIDLLEHPLIG